MTRNETWKLAGHWIADWNAHDLDSIMTLVTLRCADSEAHKKSVRVIVNER
jgi:hypothetical protein